MRQWNVPVKVLCTKHLSGEHCEQHMMFGTIKKNISIQGYIDKNLFEIHNIIKRHDELADELVRRKKFKYGITYNIQHNSPLIYDGILEHRGIVNVEENLQELTLRCTECRERIKIYLEE